MVFMMQHVPVLLREVVQILQPRDNAIYFDGTFGGGGYSKAFLDKATCKVIATDRDDHIIPIANTYKQEYGERFSFSHAKFSDITQVLAHHEISKIDGIVLDLGISNFQITSAERGFSFQKTGPLSMQMGLCEESALDVIRNYKEKDLADIIYQYGEEHYSRRIAKNIKKHIDNICTTTDLANVIHDCMPCRNNRIDSATKTFQALRIFVNGELSELETLLEASISVLNRAGKIIIVSFHSLEDRIVKVFFRNLARSGKAALITKKPITPSEDEIKYNPKSRSAKLRAISML